MSINNKYMDFLEERKDQIILS